MLSWKAGFGQKYSFGGSANRFCVEFFPGYGTRCSLMLTLEFPNEKHRGVYEGMVHVWRNAETPTSPGKLFTGKDFDEFLSSSANQPSQIRQPIVPAHLLFLAHTDPSRLLGAIQIRHHINHPNLIENGGHIGYGVCPSERRKGFAKRMRALALLKARKIGLSRLLVTCKDANIGSWKVIESNGSMFERTTYDEGHRRVAIGSRLLSCVVPLWSTD